MPTPLPTEPATRDSWKTLPLPEVRAALDFTESYTTDEFARIQQGLVPRQMEDKWFVF